MQVEQMTLRVRVLSRGSLGLVLGWLVVSCGGTVSDGQTGTVGPCESPVVGSWTGTTRSDHLDIFQDRSFRYRGADGCTDQGVLFSCPEPSATSGTFDIRVTSSLGRTCLPLGDHSCAYTVSASTFSYDCTGGGSLEYTK